jgi:hypothetical protein
MEGETISLNIKAEEEASTEAVVEESSVNELDNPWLHWRGKGRVFLGIRDSIPGVNFRARKKDQLPLALSATLPANGTYYVILIRPLLRFYQTDYCVTLESDFLDSQAWESFDVAWPNDESEDDPALTCTEEPADVQNDTETVAGASVDDSPVPVALSTTAIEPTAAPPPEETTVEETAAVPTEEVAPAENPKDPLDVDQDDSEGAPTDAGETTVVEPVAETPAVSEPVAEGGGDTEVVQTDGGDTTLDEPAGLTVVDEPVVETPVAADPAADDSGVSESGDDPVADEYSDDPMEDSPPMKW